MKIVKIGCRWGVMVGVWALSAAGMAGEEAGLSKMTEVDAVHAEAGQAQAMQLVGMQTGKQAETLSAIVGHLDRHAPPVLRGEFKQERRMSGFSKPLVSTGSFVIVRGQGLIWETAAPFASTLLIQAQRTLSIIGGETNIVDASAEPGLQAFNGLLIALLSGELPTEQDSFRVDLVAMDGANAWQLQLAPVDAGWTRFIRQVDMSGDTFVREVRLQEGSGDTVHIHFTDQRAGTLTAAEAEWF